MAGRGRALHHLSILYYYYQRFDEAITLGEHCLANVIKVGYPMPQAYLSTWLAAFLLAHPHKRKETEQIQTLLTKSEDLFAQLKNSHGTAWMLIQRAHLLLLQEDLVAAKHDFQTSLAIATDIRDPFFQYLCLMGLAELALPSIEEAIRALAQATVLRRAVGMELQPVFQEQQERLLSKLPPNREQHPAWSLGQQDAQVRLERSPFSSLQTRKEERVDDLPVSAREKEVLTLVAQGLSNRAIAHKLVISEYTVNAHLRAIYEKLHISSRTAATRIAVQARLV